MATDLFCCEGQNKKAGVPLTGLTVTAGGRTESLFVDQMEARRQARVLKTLDLVNRHLDLAPEA